MQGGETGESFAEAYEKALNVMDIRGFDQMSEEQRGNYSASINYLAEFVPDPENKTQNFTRLAIYKRYQQQ